MKVPTAICRLFLLIGVLAALSLAIAAPAEAQGLRRNAVYVMSNLPEGNTILAFRPGSGGLLTPAGEYSTGGLGNGDKVDALGSQGSLVLEGELLFAVNAGSDEISALRVHRDELELRSTVSSGGDLPVSLAVDGDLLYVLNAGSGDVTGFRVGGDGSLDMIADSTRELPGGADGGGAQVSFTPDGSSLVVTEKDANQIAVLPVDENGLAGEAVVTASNGDTPFGFDFDGEGRLVVTEAFGGAEDDGAVSTYSMGDDRSLAVVTGSGENGQTAPCWVAVTDNSKHAYVSNTGSGTISEYRIREDGSLSLRHAVAYSTDAKPVDLALGRGSRILYVVVNEPSEIAAFRVRGNGNLVQLGTSTELPRFSQGIAVR